MGIVARQLTKRFGEVTAVAGLDLTVAPGEIYGLIGPNGAGKTTTLRLLAGLMQPSAGSARVQGHDVLVAPERARGCVGFLTGSTGLYARLTPRELLGFFGQLYGLPRREVRERAVRLAEGLGFTHLLDRRCGVLSTGERQRVSLARATIHQPPVLILDEPTAGLDVLASSFVAEFLRQLRAEGRALLFSTHYLSEAELLCDRIGLLYRGRLLREGTPAALREETGARSLEEAFLRLVGVGGADPPGADEAPGAEQEGGAP